MNKRDPIIPLPPPIIFSSVSCCCGCTLFVNLQLQNIARERDKRKGASNDFISLTSRFLFIDEPSKDESATRILRELTLK